MAKSTGKGKKDKWYETGKDGWDKAKKGDEAAQKRRDESRDPRKNRFWLESDTSAKITFLDNPGFFLHEHNLKMDGRWGNYETCIKDFDTCPICESGENSAYVVVGTVISHKVWRDREDREHKNEKLLFVAKGRARQRLMRQIDLRDGDLTRCVYEMARGSIATECATGEDFEFLKRLEADQLKKLTPSKMSSGEFLKPLDYEEVFQPKTAEQLRELVGGEKPVGADDEAEKAIDEAAEEQEGTKGKKGKGKKAEEAEEETEAVIDDLL